MGKTHMECLVDVGPEAFDRAYSLVYLHRLFSFERGSRRPVQEGAVFGGNRNNRLLACRSVGYLPRILNSSVGETVT